MRTKGAERRWKAPRSTSMPSSGACAARSCPVRAAYRVKASSKRKVLSQTSPSTIQVAMSFGARTTASRAKRSA